MREYSAGGDGLVSPGLLERLGHHPRIAIVGFHVDIGSQVFDVDALLAHGELVVELPVGWPRAARRRSRRSASAAASRCPPSRLARLCLEKFVPPSGLIVSGRERHCAFRPMFELSCYLTATSSPRQVRPVAEPRGLANSDPRAELALTFSIATGSTSLRF